MYLLKTSKANNTTPQAKEAAQMVTKTLLNGGSIDSAVQSVKSIISKQNQNSRKDKSSYQLPIPPLRFSTGLTISRKSSSSKSSSSSSSTSSSNKNNDKTGITINQEEKGLKSVSSIKSNYESVPFDEHEPVPSSTKLSKIKQSSSSSTSMITPEQIQKRLKNSILSNQKSRKGHLLFLEETLFKSCHKLKDLLIEVFNLWI